MATNKYVSLSNLTIFFDKLKVLFATKDEVSKKSDKSHIHSVSDVSGLLTNLNNKADAAHGTHVDYSTTVPLMDGTASVGSASTIARSDHVHPTDTSRAAQTDLDALETVVAGKANSSHTHTIANVTNLQTTLDGKAASSHTHTVANISDLTATATELNYVDGVTSAIQTQLNSKQATITGGATTITGSNLTANRALISNGSGKVAVSAVTSTELGYLDGVTSNVQTQLDGKSASGHTHNYAGSSSVGGAATSANKLNTNAGDTNIPVYFNNGIPVACTSLDLNTTGSSASCTGNAATASAVAWTGVTSKPSYYDAKAIKGITRSGTTFTYTCMDGTTGTFTQQDNNTTYSAATTSAAGLMTAADKTKLNGIATGANKITVDSAMSTTSTNPVQNKVVKAAIDKIALTVTSDGVLVLSI